MRPRTPLACALLATLAVAQASPAAGNAVRVLKGSDQVEGTRVDAYPALWWQWLNRQRWGAQASQDPTGAHCALDQDGPVWFLAGTDGTDEAHRQCRVPEGKYVFAPIITILATSHPGTPLSCEQVKAMAASSNDHVVFTEVSVDGVRLPARELRMHSDCFSAYRHATYLSPEAHTPSATDGYWLMLPPLPKGRHVLRVDAHYDNPGDVLGNFEQHYQYELDVGGRDPAEDEEQPRQWLQT